MKIKINSQWGITVLINTGSGGAFYFPIYFPNSCLIAITVAQGFAVNANAGNIVSGNTSSIAIELFNWGPITAKGKNIAIGN